MKSLKKHVNIDCAKKRKKDVVVETFCKSNWVGKVSNRKRGGGGVGGGYPLRSTKRAARAQKKSTEVDFKFEVWASK